MRFWHSVKLLIESARNSCGRHLLYGWLANFIINYIFILNSGIPFIEMPGGGIVKAHIFML